VAERSVLVTGCSSGFGLGVAQALAEQAWLESQQNALALRAEVPPERWSEVRYEDLPLGSRAGRRVEVEVVANLYDEGGRPMIQCNIRYITARKLAEEMTQRNLKLQLEIARKERVAEGLQAQRNEQSRILKQTRAQQRQLRDFSHRILYVQEDERKRISRELHDVIAQTLVGINVQLALLDRGVTASPATFRRQVSKTQLMVKKAVGIVHDFARELRPPHRPQSRQCPRHPRSATGQRWRCRRHRR
jgi:signal transduction histidine kinase